MADQRRPRRQRNSDDDKHDQEQLRELLRAALREDPALVRSLLTDPAPAPKAEDDDDRPLTAKQAAEWGGLSESTLRDYRRRKLGPAYSVIGDPNGKGSLVRYTKRALRAWIERTSVDPTAATQEAAP